MVPSELYDHALETGMFEYDNGNMKMYHDIDMDNHRIKNIPPATNPTDLLMKKSIQPYSINTTGVVDTLGGFMLDGAIINMINVFIKKVRVAVKNSHNQNDTLTIYHWRESDGNRQSSNINRYNFTYIRDYSNAGHWTIININQFFYRITGMSLKNGIARWFLIESAPFEFIV